MLRLGWYPFSYAGTNNVLKIDYARLLLHRSWEWQLPLEEFLVRSFNSLTSISASAAPASFCPSALGKRSAFPASRKLNPAQAFIIINAKQSFDFQINSRFVFIVRHFNKIFLLLLQNSTGISTYLPKYSVWCWYTSSINQLPTCKQAWPIPSGEQRLPWYTSCSRDVFLGIRHVVVTSSMVYVM